MLHENGNCSNIPASLFQKLEFELGTAPLKAGDEVKILIKDWEMVGRNRWVLFT